jgi:hypothetical protein
MDSAARTFLLDERQVRGGYLAVVVVLKFEVTLSLSTQEQICANLPPLQCASRFSGGP